MSHGLHNYASQYTASTGEKEMTATAAAAKRRSMAVRGGANVLELPRQRLEQKHPIRIHSVLGGDSWVGNLSTAHCASLATVQGS